MTLTDFETSCINAIRDAGGYAFCINGEFYVGLDGKRIFIKIADTGINWFSNRTVEILAGKEALVLFGEAEKGKRHAKLPSVADLDEAKWPIADDGLQEGASVRHLNPRDPHNLWRKSLRVDRLVDVHQAKITIDGEEETTVWRFDLELIDE